MAYVIKDTKKERYVRGRAGGRQKWTSDIEKARVFTHRGFADMIIRQYLRSIPHAVSLKIAMSECGED